MAICGKLYLNFKKKTIDIFFASENERNIDFNQSLVVAE